MTQHAIPFSPLSLLKTKTYFVRSGYRAPNRKMITFNWILKELGEERDRGQWFSIRNHQWKFGFFLQKTKGTLNQLSNPQRQWLRWSRGCVLASSTQVRGFNPGRSRRIFQGEKIPSTPSFGGEVKPAVPCRRFAACKRSLNITWKSAFRQNSRLIFLAH
jgi:hypothetical protein